MPVLRVNKSDITGENAFNGDPFEIEYNHESSKDEKHGFRYFNRFATRCPAICILLIFVNFKKRLNK